MSEEKSVVVFCHELSSPYRKVAMALHEKGVKFETRAVDLGSYANYENWYLAINPRGEVPVLQHGDEYIIDSNVIMEYVDQKFGSPHDLFPLEPEGSKVKYFLKRFEDIPIQGLTFGVSVIHRGKVTDFLRHPFSDPSFADIYSSFLSNWPQKLLDKTFEHRESEIGNILHAKAVRVAKDSQRFGDFNRFKSVMETLDSVLDEIESYLGSPDRVGSWLCGAKFTAADICFTALLLRLYQLGLDEKLWKGGVRPNVAVYQEIAFQRPSFEQATQFSKARKDVLYLPTSEFPGVDAASLGLGLVLAFGAFYILRKFKK